MKLYQFEIANDTDSMVCIVLADSEPQAKNYFLKQIGKNPKYRNFRKSESKRYVQIFEEELKKGVLYYDSGF